MNGVTAWLLAFLVHSTLWCGAAWLGLRLFPRTHPRLKETIWCTALAASLITPTTRAFISPEAAMWRLPAPAFVSGAERPDAEGEQGEHNGGVVVAPIPLRAGDERRGSGEAAHGDREAAHSDAAVSPGWSVPAGAAWLILASGLLAFYLLRLAMLRRRLVHREPVAHPRASRALASLSRRAALDSPPRLTECHALGSPLALGVGPRREICVPVRAFHELDDGELTALLGHEVAHHRRRDTIRLGILNVLQAVFFFQPLIRLAVREVRLATEEQCDDWAASQLEDRFAMASCLTEVAGWVVPRDRSIPVPCIGRRRSQLERRVRRLLNERGLPQPPAGGRRGMSVVGLLALAPLLAPAVAPAGDLPHEDGRPSEHLQPREHEGVRGHEGEPYAPEHLPVPFRYREHREHR
ncbi:MAG: M56 family metallopeptidase [Gemmatimonadales bacterium]|nr:M56 family metallopeptidase [Gemmatimonadales bacterium]MYG48566.1 M56 family metallopeptidase [Gemmatimonadales bacterium]MYK01297.1 M56 family metallopeptidase [Candidatus Palauibacter ramosifaciens]